MVRPFVASNLAIESGVVIIPTAHIDYKKIIEMVFLEVGGYIFNVVAVGLFDEI